MTWTSQGSLRAGPPSRLHAALCRSLCGVRHGVALPAGLSRQPWLAARKHRAGARGGYVRADRRRSAGRPAGRPPAGRSRRLKHCLRSLRGHRLCLPGRIRRSAAADRQRRPCRRYRAARTALRRPGRHRLDRATRLSIWLGSRRRVRRLCRRHDPIRPTHRSVRPLVHHRREQQPVPCHRVPCGACRPIGRTADKRCRSRHPPRRFDRYGAFVGIDTCFWPPASSSAATR